MRTGISLTLTTSDWNRLEDLVADGNTAQKHVWRARIVLLSAAGHGTHAIMREAGVAKMAVCRWQERFAQEGGTASCAIRPGAPASHRSGRR